MYQLPDWSTTEPDWTEDTLLLLFSENLQDLPHVSLQTLLDKSKEFPIEFPLSTTLCKTLINNIVDARTLERNINSTYPLLHENVLKLCADFILHKRNFGSRVEKKFYANLSVLDLVAKLLAKRAVSFLHDPDRYRLIDGIQGNGDWEVIGSDWETEKINLQKCLSYDELKLSAFLSVSSYTYFINNGSRQNRGKSTRYRDKVEDEGIIIGLVGTRLKKMNVMEYQDLVIGKRQNTQEFGFGPQETPNIKTLFAQFYEKPSYTYDYISKEKKNDENFPYQLEMYFDNFTYAKRIALSIDTLLIEANARAMAKKTMAFIHVVGIGLGVWELFDHQSFLFLQICTRRIELLGKNLLNISDVYFAYFPDDATLGKYKSGDLIKIQGHPKKGIKVFLGKREPHEKLSGKNKGKLLVVSYAAEGNALPGNGFWYGSLSGSGGAAAASSTQIVELHNPHINPKVCIQSLRIAMPSSGVLTLNEYKEKILQQFFLRNYC